MLSQYSFSLELDLNGHVFTVTRRLDSPAFVTLSGDVADLPLPEDRGKKSAEERARFAGRVAAALAPGGLWLSLIGSTEDAAREVGPPRRSAREISLAIEPVLEIVELRAAEFRGHGAQAWFCLSRRRTIPTQSSASGEVAID